MPMVEIMNDDEERNNGLSVNGLGGSSSFLFASG